VATGAWLDAVIGPLTVAVPLPPCDSRIEQGNETAPYQVEGD